MSKASPKRWMVYLLGSSHVKLKKNEIENQKDLYLLAS